jgi:hypothetical protein
VDLSSSTERNRVAKIIKATDYGFRKVILVTTNPDDPKWVHEAEDGTRTAAPSGHTAGPDVVCEDCRMNWKIQEFVWTGLELSKSAPTPGNPKRRIDKTDAELVDEIKASLAASVTLEEIAGLVGSEV